MATTAEAAMADSIVSDAETTEIDDRQEEPSNVVCDAVLCFLWNKMDLIVHDTLIKLTCDYFETSAIETAKNTLFQSNAVAASDVPFRRRKGQLKSKHNVEDILFVLHKHPAGLPAFAVCDLSTLPPLDTKNVDFAHLLGEMRAIRAEMANLRETVVKITKKEAPSAQAPLIDSSKPPQLPQIGRQLLTSDSSQCRPTGISTYRYTNNSTTDSIPEQAAGSRPVSSERRLKPTYAATISSTVAAIRSSGRDDPARSDDGFTLVKKRTRPSSLKTKAVIGTMGSSTVKAKTGRYVAVFISRLLPETTAEEMEAFVQDTHHLSSKCVKLDTKHQSYASFKVEVTCDNIPDMYDPEKWPVGAYVRRYYNDAAF